MGLAGPMFLCWPRLNSTPRGGRHDIAHDRANASIEQAKCEIFVMSMAVLLRASASAQDAGAAQAVDTCRGDSEILLRVISVSRTVTSALSRACLGLRANTRSLI